MTTCEQRRARHEGWEADYVQHRTAISTGGWRPASTGLAHPSSALREAVGKYLKWALLHPYNLLAMASTVVVALISWSGLILVFGLVLELLFLSLVPTVGLFRRLVGASVESAERAAQLKARDELVAQMGPGHKDELARLDALIKKTRDNAQRKATAVGLTDDFLGLDRLTASYIRLAIAHRVSEECLSMTNRVALAATIRSLEAVQASVPDRTRRLVQRRLSIAHQRAQCWDRTRDHVVAISHQLATILELVHLMHDRSVTTLDSREVCDEVERFLTDLEDNEGVIVEVAGIGGPDEDVEQKEPRLGRYAPRPSEGVA